MSSLTDKNCYLRKIFLTVSFYAVNITYENNAL